VCVMEFVAVLTFTLQEGAAYVCSFGRFALK
jgi:hypothetical protein